MDGGKSNLGHRGKSDPHKAMKKENGDLKRIIGELMIANDVLKKPWRQTDIEGGQNDARAAEPPQVLGLFGRLASTVVL